MFHHAMRGGYLKPTPLKPYRTYDDHLVWPIHVPRCCEPLITPHLSLWGNARTRVIFPTHRKSHNPDPQGGGGEGGQDGYITLGGGVGGVPAKPGSYIFLDACVMMKNTLANQPPKSDQIWLENRHLQWFQCIILCGKGSGFPAERSWYSILL